MNTLNEISQKELERAILAMIFANSKNHTMIFALKPRYFQDRNRADIFKTCQHLFESGEEIVPVLVEQLLENGSQRHELLDLMLDDAPLSVLCKRYCDILFKNWLKFHITKIKTIEEFEAIEQEKQEFLISGSPLRHISHDADNFIKTYESNQKSSICTFFNKIDEYVGSFQGGDYIVLGAVTGAGKTAIALNVAANVCLQGKKVLYCSLEMKHKQLQNRFVCMMQGLGSAKFRSAGFNSSEMEELKKGLAGLKEWKLHILDDYFLTPSKLRVYAKNKYFDFIVVDYLGLMSGGANKSSYERVTALSRELKLIAGDLDVPIMALVQLNRSLKDRQDKRPILSDIRESGAIEQDADFVFFAYRPFMYDEKADKSVLELINAKNRHGQSNVVEVLNFNLETQRIKSLWV